MKIQVKAKELKNALAAMLAMHEYGKSEGRQPCVLTVTDKGLQVESTSLGAYFCQLIEGKVLRAGTCGIDAKDLSLHKLQSDVVLDLQKSGSLKVTFGRTVVNLGQDAQAVAELKDLKQSLPKIEPTVRIPSLMLKSAVEFTAFSPIMKANVHCQVKVDPGIFEYAVSDSVALARYANKSDAVQVKQPLAFVLLAGLMDQVLKEVNPEGFTMIGISDDGAIVRFASADFLLYHPAMEKEIEKWADLLKMIRKEPLMCGFFSTPQQLKKGIDQVKVVGKGDKGLNITMNLMEKKVVLTVGSGEHIVNHTIVLDSLKVKNPGDRAAIKEAYFGQFVSLAPKTKIKVSLHGSRYLLLEADTGNDVQLQYTVVQSVV